MYNYFLFFRFTFCFLLLCGSFSAFADDVLVSTVDDSVESSSSLESKGGEEELEKITENNTKEENVERNETTTDISKENKDTPPKSENDAIQILRDRQTKIQETLEKSDEEKKIDKDEDALERVQIEKKNIEEINEGITKELEALQKEVSEKKTQEKLLKQSLETEKQKNITSQKDLENLGFEIITLEKNITSKNLLLERNAAEIENLSQEEALKEYYLEQSLKNKKELERLTAEENEGKYTIFYRVSGLFIVMYIGRIYFSRKIKHSRRLKKKYGHKLTAFDVFSVLFYIGFLVWFFFYIKPELVVYLLFLVGAVVIVIQEYLYSMISSIFMIQLYSVGDRVLFEKKEGIIEKMNLLKIHLRTIDERGTDMAELRVVSNSQFMKKEVTLLPKNEIEKSVFRLVLPNDLSLNEPALIQHIEEKILQKNITVKSFNEITEKEYFYDIDFSFTSTGHPVIEIFWYETREKNNRIKRKILGELEKIKKESQKGGDKLFIAEEDGLSGEKSNDE